MTTIIFEPCFADINCRLLDTNESLAHLNRQYIKRPLFGDFLSKTSQLTLQHPEPRIGHDPVKTCVFQHLASFWQ